MIRLEDYWMGRDTKYASEMTSEIEDNAEGLLSRVNDLLAAMGMPDRAVRSGWRPQEVNDATANAAANSRHMTGEAVDLDDPDRSLARAIMLEVDVLTHFNLYMEDSRWTPTWVHLQSVPPHSGRRVFVPSTNPPLAPPVLA